MINNSDIYLGASDKYSDLLRLYKTKMSVREIAEKLHVSQTSLYAKIKKSGLKRERRYKKKSIDIKLFKELIKIGASNISIAGKLHICTDTVIRLKKQYGYATQDEQQISKGQKGAACRTYYKKTGLRPDCPNATNVLEQYEDDVISLLKNGVSKTEIAKRYGVCTSTVYNFIHMYDIDAPIKKICDDKEQLIKESFASGESIEDISNKLNCHFSTVYSAIKNMKLSRLQSRVNRKSILGNQEEKIRQLYEQGVSGTEIAKQIGVSYPALYEFIHRKKFAQRPLKRRSVFDGRDEELMQMRQDKMTLEQIGEYFGVKTTTVWHRMQKLQSQDNEYPNI